MRKLALRNWKPCVLLAVALSLAPLLSRGQGTSRVIPFNNIATTLPPCAAPPDPACPKPVNVTVQLWQDAVSVAPADLIFSEAQPSASLDDAGSVSFVFGSETAGGLNPAHFPSGSSRFLDVVDPASGASVLAARLPLNATPFALSPGPQGPPGVVQSVTAGDPSLTVGGTSADPTVAVANGGITTAKLAAGAVGTAQIAGNAVTSTQLAPNAVTGSNVADGALSPAKIAGTAATLGANTFSGPQVMNMLTVQGQDAFTANGFEPFLTLRDSNVLPGVPGGSHRIQSAHGDLGIFQSPFTQPPFGLVFLQRMVVKDGTGNVGIGTTSPIAKLHAQAGSSGVGGRLGPGNAIFGE